MEFEFDFNLLKELTEASGPVGYEDEVREIVREKLADATDRVYSDAMGNVVGTINGDSDYSVAIAAHIDEWGWMVDRVTDDGFLALKILGGTNPFTARSQRVTVRTETGNLTGIIGAVPPHMLDDNELDKRPTGRSEVWDVEDVYVELGMAPEKIKKRVSPGDVVTLQQDTIKMGEHVTGKAFDNRALVAIMIEAARRIEEPDVTLHFAATTQEEVGLRGAEALATDLNPDLAIALDITIADDQPYFEENKSTISEVGEGTAIKIKDHSSITNPKVNKRLRKVAEQEDIPYQLEIHSSGGTDAGAFQTNHGATPVGAVLLPTRNIHSTTASAHNKDVSATIDLLTAFLETETGSDYVL